MDAGHRPSGRNTGVRTSGIWHFVAGYGQCLPGWQGGRGPPAVLWWDPKDGISRGKVKVLPGFLFTTEWASQGHNRFLWRALALGHSGSPWRAEGWREMNPSYSELSRSPAGALKMEKHCPLTTSSTLHNLKTTPSELQCLWASPGEGPNTNTGGCAQD